MDYLLMVSDKDRLLWVPLTPNNKEVLAMQRQQVHPDFRITVETEDELKTKGQAFLDKLLYAANNHLN